MNSISYHAEIQSILDEGIKEAIGAGHHTVDDVRDFLSDSWLHETIDGHEFVIYYSKADAVVHLSPNSDAYLDCYSMEDIGRMVADGGLDQIDCIRAYFAMQQDVWDAWDDDAVGEVIRGEIGRLIADGSRGVAGQCDHALLNDAIWQAFCDALDLDEETRESGTLPADWSTEDVADALEGLSVEVDGIAGQLEWVDGDLFWMPEV